MRFEDYRKHDATALAELVASGTVTATELLDAALARLAEVNPGLNAVTTLMDDVARRQVVADGPFAGVPFLIKDLGQDYEGLPTGSGSRSLQGIGAPAAPAHSEVVRRWLASGLVIFGKTNTPEFGLKAITEPAVNGATRNPWNRRHTPGGSSGGAAAAVAAGIVPVAGASDGGGSIRIPAACCGLFGLKVGRGMVPSGPAMAENLNGAGLNGVISRSVRDSAGMLDVIAGPDIGGPYLPAMPSASFADLARRDPGLLHIGMSTASPIGAVVDPEAILAVESTAELLRSLGHTVEVASTGIDEKGLAADFLTVWFASMATTVDRIERAAGTGKPADIEIDTAVCVALGRRITAPTYLAAQQRFNTYTRDLERFHSRYDLLLTPTMATPPARIGERDTPRRLKIAAAAVLKLHGITLLEKTDVVQNMVDANLSRTPYTQLANVTGRPAMSVPLHWTADGLPMGVQFVGPLGSEGRLLALATQLETARPWWDRVPGA